eukprot:TRINITY_DN17013_c0_g1_i1.p1 TRINITY_DN17013_c0_g1~~TRINITY_DN17013_c0_g1_i1.p1  ORF type:complete len:527 (-),score=92.25 TRINITY_DN17013_c0_g1_i1:563-2098(-)
MERGLEEKKVNVMQNLEHASKELKGTTHTVQPTEALKIFFDRIPLYAVPGIRNERVVEVNSGDIMGDAITSLYKENVMGAPVRDASQPETVPLADRYVGLVDFAGMVLWALQEFEVEDSKAQVAGLVVKAEGEDASTAAPNSDHADLEQLANQTIQANTDSLLAESGQQKEAKGILSALGLKSSKDNPKDKETRDQDTEEFEKHGFFGLLNKLEKVRSAKVEVLAKSFRWGGFLPVRPEDSLLHVLMLLSKHRLKAVPVVEENDSTVTAFITQAAAIQLLLRLVGLSWFDDIAEKPLSSYRFDADRDAGQIVLVYSDDALSTALDCMWKQSVNSVPVINRETNEIIGNVRNSDLRLLLDTPDLFNRRRSITVQEFMKADADKVDRDRPGEQSKADQPLRQFDALEEQLGTIISAAALTMGPLSVPKMVDPVTFKPECTLRRAMETLLNARSERGYLVDEEKQVRGVVTSRDIITLFAPPLAEAPGQWAGFFESALQDTGTRVEFGKLVLAS